MERKKIMVDQEKIKELLRLLKPYTIYKRLDVPISVIEDIQDGKDRPSFYRRPVKDFERYCTCCGIRKKMPGAKYLCFVCSAEHSQDIGDEEYVCHL